MWEVFKRSKNKFFLIRRCSDTELESFLFEILPLFVGEVLEVDRSRIVVFVRYQIGQVVAVKETEEVLEREDEKALAFTSVPA